MNLRPTMKVRKSSQRISLLLLGAAAAGCGHDAQPQLGDTVYRDGYPSYEDCRSQWPDADCEYGEAQAAGVHEGMIYHGYYGPYRSSLAPLRSIPADAQTVSERVSSANFSRVSSNFRSASSGSISRGGFGETGAGHAGGEGGGE